MSTWPAELATTEKEQEAASAAPAAEPMPTSAATSNAAPTKTPVIFRTGANLPLWAIGPLSPHESTRSDTARCRTCQPYHNVTTQSESSLPEWQLSHSRCTYHRCDVRRRLARGHRSLAAGVHRRRRHRAARPVRAGSPVTELGRVCARAHPVVGLAPRGPGPAVGGAGGDRGIRHRRRGGARGV